MKDNQLYAKIDGSDRELSSHSSSSRGPHKGIITYKNKKRRNPRITQTYIPCSSSSSSKVDTDEDMLPDLFEFDTVLQPEENDSSSNQGGEEDHEAVSESSSDRSKSKSYKKKKKSHKSAHPVLVEKSEEPEPPVKKENDKAAKKRQHKKNKKQKKKEWESKYADKEPEI